MAHLFSVNILWTLLLITCFFTYPEKNLAEFPRIQHYAEKNRFSTAFLAIGDWGRNGYFNQSKVATQMGDIGRKLGINFVISTGDNFYTNGIKNVNDPLFQNSFTKIYTAKSLQTPWYTVLGNHDYMGNTTAQLSPKLRDIDKRWRCRRNFILESGPAEIFFVDTTPFVDQYFNNNTKQHAFDWRGVLPRKKYLTDLKQDLNYVLGKSKAYWKIVVGHHTIRSIGHHGDTQEVVDQLLPILEENRVDMYINGHDHCLQHLSNKKGSMQFLTSGGGSKAWKNDIHRRTHNGTVHFYHDGQGFLSAKINLENAALVFYGVSGKPLHNIQLKPRRG